MSLKATMDFGIGTTVGADFTLFAAAPAGGLEGKAPPGGGGGGGGPPIMGGAGGGGGGGGGMAVVVVCQQVCPARMVARKGLNRRCVGYY